MEKKRVYLFNSRSTLFAIIIASALWSGLAAQASEAGLIERIRFEKAIENVIANHYATEIKQHLAKGEFAVQARASVSPNMTSLAACEQALLHGASLYGRFCAFAESPTLQFQGASLFTATSSVDELTPSQCRVEVSLILHSRFSDLYARRLQTGLEELLTIEFGNIARAKVSKFRDGLGINSEYVESIKPRAHLEAATSNLDYYPFSFVQIIMVAMMLQAATYLTGAFMRLGVKVFRSRERSKSKNAEPLRNDVAIAAPLRAVKIEKNLEDFLQQQKSAAIYVLSLGKVFSVIAETWYREESEGRRKLAAIIDAMLSWNDSEAELERHDGIKRKAWELPVAVEQDKAFMLICRRMSEFMPLEVRVELLSRAMSDLKRQTESSMGALKAPLKNALVNEHRTEVTGNPVVRASDSAPVSPRELKSPRSGISN